MRVLGIIPARGGSRGVPRKNLRMVAGSPLVAYTIRAARASDRLTDFFLSTEDEEIRCVAEALGCPVIERPRELAADDTPTPPVLVHAVRSLEGRKAPYDAVAVLQPTTPMRTGADIDEAILRFEGASARSLVSVYRVEDAHPARMYLLKEGFLVPFADTTGGARRQELPAVYHRNGAIYLCSCSYLLAEGKVVSPDCIPYVMSRSRSVNIDDEFDLLVAGLLMREERRNVRQN